MWPLRELTIPEAREVPTFFTHLVSQAFAFAWKSDSKERDREKTNSRPQSPVLESQSYLSALRNNLLTWKMNTPSSPNNVFRNLVIKSVIEGANKHLWTLNEILATLENPRICGWISILKNK